MTMLLMILFLPGSNYQYISGCEALQNADIRMENHLVENLLRVKQKSQEGGEARKSVGQGVSKRGKGGKDIEIERMIN